MTDTPAWHVELAPELQGVAQTRGWDVLPPEKAAGEILKSYRELELYRGAPADRLLKLPAKSEAEAPEEWRDVWTRLGAPAEPAGYEFGEGTPEDLATALRSRYAALGLPKDKARELTAEFVKTLQTREGAAAETRTMVAETARRELQQKWGHDFEAKKFVAQQAAMRSGITAEALTAMEETVGYPAVMEHFHRVGASLQDDKFVGGGNPQPGPLTPEQAATAKQALMADSEWVTKYLAGNAKARADMHKLNVIITGASP